MYICRIYPYEDSCDHGILYSYNPGTRDMTEIYAQLLRACKLLCSTFISLMLSSVSSIVSESLIVKDKFRLWLFESELASHFCLQVPGWCPCGNCRDFVPSVSLLVEAEDLVKDNLKIRDMNHESYHLMLKQKASATGTAAPNAAGGGRKAVKENATACQDTNEEFTNQPNKRFQFDSFSNDLQSFKEGECAVNTAKSNERAL